MMSMMAEMANGPCHVGEADFDSAHIFYHPGVEYFAELVQSKFFASISGGKLPGDT
jgi:hypothetical protein